MEIDITDVRKWINEAVEKAVSETARKLGYEKMTFNRAYIIKKYGEAEYEKSLWHVNWQKKGTAKNSPVTCLRSDFEDYLRKNNIEFKH